MKDFKIGKKLFLGFGSLCILLLIICAASFYGIAKGNARTNELYDSNLIAIDAVGELREIFQEERALTRNLIMFDPSHATYQSSVALIAERDVEFLAALDKYETTIDTQEDRVLFEGLKKVFNDEYAVFKKELKEFTDNRDTEGALQYLVDALPINTALVKYLDDIAVLNDEYARETIDAAKRAFVILLCIGIPIILITIFWSLYLIRYLDKNISRKITKIVDAANELAVGNINVAVDADSKDEIGDLADAFNTMIRSIREQAKIAEAISEGDMTVSYTPNSGNDTMGKALVKTIDGLGDIFSAITTSVSQVNAGAEQVSAGAQSLSQGATEQASSIQELAATIASVSDQVRNNAQNATDARELSEKAGDEVSKGNEQMTRMIEAMNDINNSSSEISKIIKVIDDIAFQTNILALNAAVEAARAGAAGKGFAVVADEVRNLAAKSAAAAKNTTALIEGSISRIAEGARIVDHTADSLRTIVQSVTEVSELVNLIDDASAQQASSLAQIAQGIEQISAVVQTNSATAEESAAASEELSGQANMLSGILSKLKLKNSEGSSYTQNKTNTSSKSGEFDFSFSGFGDKY